ncbi:MAG: hypothetical protein IPK80_02525 [Nannocystis sp.]|nr:hypothetical protein [Nannocystis sp.]
MILTLFVEGAKAAGPLIAQYIAGLAEDHREAVLEALERDTKALDAVPSAMTSDELRERREQRERERLDRIDATARKVFAMVLVHTRGSAWEDAGEMVAATTRGSYEIAERLENARAEWLAKRGPR